MDFWYIYVQWLILKLNIHLSQKARHLIGFTLILIILVISAIAPSMGGEGGGG